MISNLLSLGHVIEENGDMRGSGNRSRQDDCHSAGEPCQCEYCLLEELNEAVADLKLLASDWAKAKKSHVPHCDA